MASLGESLNDEMLQEMIKEADLDGDNFINFEGMGVAMKSSRLDKTTR